MNQESLKNLEFYNASHSPVTGPVRCLVNKSRRTATLQNHGELLLQLLLLLLQLLDFHHCGLGFHHCKLSSSGSTRWLPLDLHNSALMTDPAFFHWNIFDGVTPSARPGPGQQEETNSHGSSCICDDCIDDRDGRLRGSVDGGSDGSRGSVDGSDR